MRELATLSLQSRALNKRFMQARTQPAFYTLYRAGSLAKWQSCEKLRWSFSPLLNVIKTSSACRIWLPDGSRFCHVGQTAAIPGVLTISSFWLFIRCLCGWCFERMSSISSGFHKLPHWALLSHQLVSGSASKLLFLVSILIPQVASQNNISYFLMWTTKLALKSDLRKEICMHITSDKILLTSC